MVHRHAGRQSIHTHKIHINLKKKKTDKNLYPVPSCPNKWFIRNEVCVHPDLARETGGLQSAALPGRGTKRRKQVPGKKKMELCGVALEDIF